MKESDFKNFKYDKAGTQKMRKLFKENSNPKVKITINIDMDVLQEIRQQAEELGAPYQTYLNKLLRDTLEQSHLAESRLDKIERELEGLKKKFG